MGFRLTVLKGKSEGKEFSFTKGRVRVGRNHDNDLVLYDLNVSRHHFEILLQGSHYILRDAGSQNGTKLNDAPALDSKLKDGDRIGIGNIEFEFNGSDTQPNIPMGGHSERAELFAPQNAEQKLKLEEIQTYAVSLKKLEELRKSGGLGAVGTAAASMHKKRPEAGAASKQATQSDGGGAPAPAKRAKRALTPEEKRAARKKRLLYPAIGVAVFSLIFGLFVAFYPTKQQDLSETQFPLARPQEGRSFGAGRVDTPTPRKAQFVWQSIGGRAVLRYVMGGIERAGEVSLELNGEKLMDVAVTGMAWGSLTELKLDRKKLKAGEPNIIAFVHHPAPGEAPRWGVRDVGLSEEAIPPPSLDKAKEALELADEAIENKKVALPNLSKAVDYYHSAVLLMEALEPHPAEYARAEAAMKAAQAELSTIVDSGIFRAEKAMKLGRADEAAQILRELVLYFPRGEDPRRADLLERLSNVEKK